MLRSLVAVCLAITALALPQVAQAQVSTGFQTAGVEVKADGVLRVKQYQGLSGPLAAAWARDAQSKLPPDIARASDKRKISLNRLEAAIEARLKAGQEITREMKFLAGLTRVENVFYYPESGDVVIAGPAEAWSEDPSGRVIGVFSGRATVELQDLITALRAYPPGKDTRAELIGCSIDPTKEGLAKMAQFFASAARNFSPSQTAQLVAGMKDNLGMQNVTIKGISPQTHFAQVLVEADYRMKLIGIGLEAPPAKITSYISKAKGASNNALQRWYFQPHYECVRVTEDNLAMELVGEGVKLSNESEVVGRDGARSESAAKDPASEAFVRTFTEEYPKLAAKVAVYAQLRNLVDLSIAAAYIQEQDLYGKASWTASAFMDERKIAVETFETPKNVESAVNAVWKGNRLYTPIGGGVSIRPRIALQTNHLLKDDNGQLKAKQEAVKVDGLAAGQWWWD